LIAAFEVAIWSAYTQTAAQVFDEEYGGYNDDRQQYRLDKEPPIAAPTAEVANNACADEQEHGANTDKLEVVKHARTGCGGLSIIVQNVEPDQDGAENGQQNLIGYVDDALISSATPCVEPYHQADEKHACEQGQDIPRIE